MMNGHEDPLERAMRVVDALPTSKINGLKSVSSIEEPISLWELDYVPPPLLPRGLLPSVIDELAFADRSLNPAAVAASALAICATAGTATIQISVHSQWKESFRLWVALCGSASAMKSPHIKLASQRLNHLNGVRAEEYSRELASWEKRTNKGKDVGADDPRPWKMTYVSQDATIEAIGDNLKNHPHGIGLVHDEISALFNKMESPYQKGGGAPRGDWLKLYDGGPHGTMRVNSDRCIYVAQHAACVLGGITTETLSRICNAPDAGDGLIARLSIVVMPPAPIVRELVPVPERVIERYNHVIDRMLASRAHPPTVIPLDEEAKGIFEGARERWLSQAQANEKELPRFSERMGKLPGLALRLALGFTLIDAATEEPDGRVARPIELPKMIDWRVMQRACDYAEFQAEHDLAFHQIAADREPLPEFKVAQKVADWLLRTRPNTFLAGEITRSVREFRRAPKNHKKLALDLLEEQRWIWPESDAPDFSAKGIKWVANPRIHVLFEQRAKAEQHRLDQIRKMIERSAAERRESQQ